MKVVVGSCMSYIRADFAAIMVTRCGFVGAERGAAMAQRLSGLHSTSANVPVHVHSYVDFVAENCIQRMCIFQSKM